LCGVALNRNKCHKTDLTSNRYWLDFGRTSWNFYGMAAAVV
jgi:hypothetical protein